jgi:hypothetical protein
MLCKTLFFGKGFDAAHELVPGDALQRVFDPGSMESGLVSSKRIRLVFVMLTLPRDSG